MQSDECEKAKKAPRIQECAEFQREMRKAVNKMINDRFPGFDAAEADRDFERRCEKLREDREKDAVRRIRAKVKIIA